MLNQLSAYTLKIIDEALSPQCLQDVDFKCALLLVMIEALG